MISGLPASPDASAMRRITAYTKPSFTSSRAFVWCAVSSRIRVSLYIRFSMRMSSCRNTRFHGTSTWSNTTVASISSNRDDGGRSAMREGRPADGLEPPRVHRQREDVGVRLLAGLERRRKRPHEDLVGVRRGGRDALDAVHDEPVLRAIDHAQGDARIFLEVA